jgi:hypothetical protein
MAMRMNKCSNSVSHSQDIMLMITTIIVTMAPHNPALAGPMAMRMNKCSTSNAHSHNRTNVLLTRWGWLHALIPPNWTFLVYLGHIPWLHA